MTTLPHLAAPPADIYWRKSVPSSTGTKMLLRTVGGVAVIGCWQGDLGQYYTAWSPMPKDQ